jgi:glutamate dehydrogenase (NADP+)
MPVRKIDARLKPVFDQVLQRSPDQPEFHQAAHEVLSSLGPVADARPELFGSALLQRLCEPERVVSFRVPWTDDAGVVHVDRGYRVEFNSALGPYKGGLRFHRSVTEGVLKFLAFEQIFKNALTGLLIGGGKGGATFDPHGRSDGEVMRFCQSLMTELYRHLGEHTDVPAGDIGVSEREIGFLFGQYRRITNRYEAGTFTGKGVDWGGAHGRVEATGYGAVYFLEAALSERGEKAAGRTCVVSGSGNVATYAIEMMHELGARVVACSDSGGYLYDADGVDIALVRQLKEVERLRLQAYVQRRPGSSYRPGRSVWDVPAELAIPAATQNEIDGVTARQMVENGLVGIVEGANMPCTPQAVAEFLDAGVVFGPGKAANAGGVAVSALEMSQNAARQKWDRAATLEQLRTIMVDIHDRVRTTAVEYGSPGDYVAGANIAGFTDVAQAMLDQGVI